MTLLFFLVIAAFITTIVAMTGRCPLWVPVFLLCTIELLHYLPPR